MMNTGSSSSSRQGHTKEAEDIEISSEEDREFFAQTEMTPMGMSTQYKSSLLFMNDVDKDNLVGYPLLQYISDILNLSSSSSSSLSGYTISTKKLRLLGILLILLVTGLLAAVTYTNDKGADTLNNTNGTTWPVVLSATSSGSAATTSTVEMAEFIRLRSPLDLVDLSNKILSASEETTRLKLRFPDLCQVPAVVLEDGQSGSGTMKVMM